MKRKLIRVFLSHFFFKLNNLNYEIYEKQENKLYLMCLSKKKKIKINSI